jgi:phosphopantetheinyl transferase (holo-ACP synthase)
MKWSNQFSKLFLAEPAVSVMKNKRKHPRKFCSQSSFFATRYGVHECFIKNLGNKGAFIETDLFLPEGNVVTVAVPSHGQKSSLKLKGKVVWTDQCGFGVEFGEAILI